MPSLRWSSNLDGYFLPKTPPEYFEAGEQAKVPLMAGSNSEEQGARSVLGQAEPTVANFADAIRRLYGEDAGEVLKVYAPKTPEEVLQAATDLASARFIAHSTWKWTELQMKTGGKPVYRSTSRFTHGTSARPAGRPPRRPQERQRKGEGKDEEQGEQQDEAKGAEEWRRRRRAELPTRPRFSRHGQPRSRQSLRVGADDRKVSETMQGYFVNFIKTGDPNGPGLPTWPGYDAQTNYMRMRIDVESKAEPETDRARYLVLDAIFAKRR